MSAKWEKLCGVPISNNFETNVKTSLVDGRSDRRIEKENKEKENFQKERKKKAQTAERKKEREIHCISKKDRLQLI